MHFWLHGWAWGWAVVVVVWAFALAIAMAAAATMAHWASEPPLRLRSFDRRALR